MGEPVDDALEQHARRVHREYLRDRMTATPWELLDERDRDVYRREAAEPHGHCESCNGCHSDCGPA